MFRVDSEFRSLESFHRAVELVRNGRIGKLHAVRTGSPREDFPDEPRIVTPPPPELAYDLWLGPAPQGGLHPEARTPSARLLGRGGWMRNLDYCDGMICNWGTHLNDIAQWGAGTDAHRTGGDQGHRKVPCGKVWNVLESFEAWYKFANGMELFYRMGVPHVRFEGEKGWIHVNYTPDKITHERLQASDPAILKEQIGAEEIHFPLKTEKADFIDAVKSRGQTLEDAEVGQRTTSLCHLAHISIKLGGAKLAWDRTRRHFPTTTRPIG